MVTEVVGIICIVYVWIYAKLSKVLLVMTANASTHSWPIVWRSRSLAVISRNNL